MEKAMPMPKLAGFTFPERILIVMFSLLDVLLSLMLWLLFVLLFSQVLFRYVFSVPLYWVEESVLYLMAYITMLGCTSAYRKYLHPQLIIIYGRLKPPGLFIYECLLRIPILTLMFVFTYYGYGYAKNNEWMRTSALEISFFWPFFAIPLGGAVAMFALIVDTIDIILFRRSWLMDINVPRDVEADRGEGTAEAPDASVGARNLLSDIDIPLK